MKRKIATILSNPWSHRALVLIIFIIIMSVFNPRFFLPANLRSILLAISIYGIMACGMLFVIIIGGIDFCIGSTAAMAGCVMTRIVINYEYSAWGFILGLLAAMLLCVLLGLFHGTEIAFCNLPPFVITLATKLLVFGAMYIFTGGSYILPAPGGAFYMISNARLFGIPSPVIWLVVFTVITALVLSYTTFGRKIYVAGGNRAASELVGINTKRYTLVAFVICSITAGIGGILLSSLNTQVYSSTASGYEGRVLTAMVVGGVDLAGGGGGIPGVMFGALFVGILNNAMTLLDVSTDYQGFVQGVVIIAAIALNVITQQRSAKMLNTDKKRERKEMVKRTPEDSPPMQ